MPESELDDFLQPLPDDRRDAVKAWLASPAVKPPCPACGEPVRVGDGKVTLKDGVHHRACAPVGA